MSERHESDHCASAREDLLLLRDAATNRLGRGELTDARRDQLVGHLAGCESCRGELVDVERFEESIRSRALPPLVATRALETRLARAFRRATSAGSSPRVESGAPDPPRRWAAPALAAAALLLAALLVIPVGSPPAIELGLTLTERSATPPDLLAPGTRFHLTVTAAAPRAVMVVGLDSHGEATLVFPFRDDTSSTWNDLGVASRIFPAHVPVLLPDPAMGEFRVESSPGTREWFLALSTVTPYSESQLDELLSWLRDRVGRWRAEGADPEETLERLRSALKARFGEVRVFSHGVRG